MHTRRHHKILQSHSPRMPLSSSSCVAPPLHNDGTVAHCHVRRLPERGTNVGRSALRSGVALLLFGAGPCPCQQARTRQTTRWPLPVMVCCFRVATLISSLDLLGLLLRPFEIPYSDRLPRNLSFWHPPFSVVVLQHPQRALRERHTPRRPRGARRNREAASIDGVGSIIFASAALTATM